jgi:hypothetical protein
LIGFEPAEADEIIAVLKDRSRDRQCGRMDAGYSGAQLSFSLAATSYLARYSNQASAGDDSVRGNRLRRFPQSARLRRLENQQVCDLLHPGVNRIF